MPIFEIFDRKPILFADHLGKSITEMPTELFNFSMESQVIEVSSGAQALRVGYYKIIDKSAVRTNLPINTHACYVLYIKDGYERPIKYYCNIGPLFNYEALYFNNENSISVYGIS